MRRSIILSTIISLAVLACGALTASAQTGQLRGHVIFKQADGTTTKAADAAVDVFRVDLPGKYPTKTSKNGEFVYAGLPYIGTYIIAVSMPNANPTYQANVKAGREIDYELTLVPGDGRRLTLDDIKKNMAGASTSSGSSGESAADKAKREELEKKNAEIEVSNKKTEDSNKIVGETFKAGNTALMAGNEADKANNREQAIKLYGDALQQYETGLAADPEQPALLTNKAAALKARGVDKYNIAVLSKDEAAKTAGIEASKADFKSAAEAANKAWEFLKKETAATDPMEQKRQAANKYSAAVVRAEAMRLFVTKADPSQVDAGIAAFQDYIAVETDSAKKSKAQLDLAQMLFDVNAYDKAKAEYEKILAERPDDPDALSNMGLILFNFGAAKEGEGKKDEAKAMYQQAANYLGRFVEKAPDGHKFKEDAKAVLAELKNQQNVQAEKPSSRPPRRRP
jgi:tetratricopeptide (TPR) repeat protein